MRWLPFAILAYVTLGLQLGLSGYDAPALTQGGRPQLVLLAAIFIALNAGRDDALLGCFLLGLLQDLCGSTPLGLSAFAYGTVALFVLSVHELVYGEHFLTHLTLGLIAGLIVAFITYCHGIIDSLIHPNHLRPPLVPLLTSALYTAILAPVVLFILHRMKKPFGFRGARGHGYR
jgi:rod shape-determining protein MreD